MENLKIETTHNVLLEYPVASIGDRLLAYIIDQFILVIYYIAVISLIIESRMDVSDDVGIALFIIFIAGPIIFYELLFENIMNGQTPGKIIMKIRVIKQDGSSPGIGSFFLRWLLRWIEIPLTGGVAAIIAIAMNGKGQRIGDMAAGTTVVKVEKKENLEDTIFEKVDDDYEVAFPEAANLNDAQISIAKELLNQYSMQDVSDTVVGAIYKAKRTFEKKMGIKSDYSPDVFFRLVIKDYNKIHGNL